MFYALRVIPVLMMVLSVTAVSTTYALDLEAGEGYVPISPAQAVQDPGKVEVIEFFWYGCPHCYRLEPYMHDWLKTAPDNVRFIRQPAVFGPRWEPHARAYFIAEALGVVDAVHADLFDAVQNQHRSLNSEDELAKFFVEQGVDEGDFRDTYRSFIVDTKMRQAAAMSARYGVTGVPAVIINGKYKTNGSLAKNFSNMIQVMNHLIESETQGQD